MQKLIDWRKVFLVIQYGFLGRNINFLFSFQHNVKRTHKRLKNGADFIIGGTFITMYNVIFQKMKKVCHLFQQLGT